ncbi:LysR substrate-binding domain-containing protein [Kineosporia rhizophila]|uniref:LysR family transcriptional regulator n=1 Tax=Kineosporia rhizophila TaxID=84633 RepID=UPI001E375D79|nr:LysR substrate-binding domain-containing protein [Kineosporia rhizophila]MCE0540822.1 LysR substrate-binding domain-containing protein [Kineosporia rhizophila]
MNDLDLRLVRYFVAVAEHQNFGRASQALHVAQPSLSRQVRRLEEVLGARLLDRTPQGTHLTPAGTAFLPRAEALLRLADQAANEARTAADPSRLIAGYTAHLIITPVVAEMRRRHPEATIEARHVEWNQPRTALLEHRVDVAVTRLPLNTDGLQVSTLYEEQRAVLMHSGHRLADRQSLTLDDIIDEPMPRAPENADPLWTDFWRLDPRPDGHPAPDGPVIETVQDKFEVVASGQAIAIVPLASGYGRPDLVGVPLLGIPPGRVALVTRAGDSRTLVGAFRELARAMMKGPTGS